METIRLTDRMSNLSIKAHESASGRSAQTIHGGREHRLRQTLIALCGGRSLDDHESPGEATLQVLAGRVSLVADGDARELITGDYVVIPPHRHRVDAMEDSAVLLTVATG